jgi:hypothetical protein
MITPDLSKLRDYEYPQIAERFYVEAQYHELTVLHDKDGYRHLRMMPPRTRSSAYWYEIVTWPGNLAFRGDGESFVFSVFGEDMFKFFRSGLWDADGPAHINATYWAEKLSTDRQCVKTYDDEKFSAYVAEILKENEEEYPGLTEAWKKATDSFMADYDIHHEHGAWDALQNFSYGEMNYGKCSCGALFEAEDSWEVKAWARKNGHQDSYNLDRPGHKVAFTRRDPFSFELSDMNFKDYDWWFLWALYGIVEAIRAYDDPKSPRRLIKNASVEDVVLAGAEKPL